MRIPQAEQRRSDCQPGSQWYSCTGNGFGGCCAVDPCALDSCPAGPAPGSSSGSGGVLTVTSTSTMTAMPTPMPTLEPTWPTPAPNTPSPPTSSVVETPPSQSQGDGGGDGGSGGISFPTGAIIGIMVSFAVILAVAAWYFMCWRRRKERPHRLPSKGGGCHWPEEFPLPRDGGGNIGGGSSSCGRNGGGGGGPVQQQPRVVVTVEPRNLLVRPGLDQHPYYGKPPVVGIRWESPDDIKFINGCQSHQQRQHDQRAVGLINTSFSSPDLITKGGRRVNSDLISPVSPGTASTTRRNSFGDGKEDGHEKGKQHPDGKPMDSHGNHQTAPSQVRQHLHLPPQPESEPEQAKFELDGKEIGRPAPLSDEEEKKQQEEKEEDVEPDGINSIRGSDGSHIQGTPHYHQHHQQQHHQQQHHQQQHHQQHHHHHRRASSDSSACSLIAQVGRDSGGLRPAPLRLKQQQQEHPTGRPATPAPARRCVSESRGRAALGLGVGSSPLLPMSPGDTRGLRRGGGDGTGPASAAPPPVVARAHTHSRSVGGGHGHGHGYGYGHGHHGNLNLLREVRPRATLRPTSREIENGVHAGSWSVLGSA